MNFESLETRDLLDLAARDVRFNNEPMFTAVTKRLAKLEVSRCNTMAALNHIRSIASHDEETFASWRGRIEDIARIET